MLAVVLTPVLVVAAFLAMVVVSLSGGLDDVFGGDRPQEGDPEVVAAREDAAAALDGDAGTLAVAVVEPALGAGAERSGRGLLTPECRVGQHNWKIDDPFDLSCDLQRIELVSLPVQDGFRSEMLGLDEALRADGWTADRWGLDLVMRDYWDSLADPAPATAPTPEPGTDPGAAERAPRGYSMDDLPAGRYTQELDGRAVTLTVGWVEHDSSPDGITYDPSWAELERADGSSADVQELVGAVPRGGYAVVLRLSVVYFEE